MSTIRLEYCEQIEAIFPTVRPDSELVEETKDEQVSISSRHSTLVVESSFDLMSSQD